MASSIKQLEFDRQLDLMKIREFRKNGDASLINELFSKYAYLVYGVGLKYLGARDQAKSLVVKVYEKLTLELVKNEIKNLRGWIYIASKSLILSDFKNNSDMAKLKVSQTDLADLAKVHPLDLNALPDTKIKKSLSKIGDQQRACIEMFYFKKKHYSDIAAEFGIDENAVKSNIKKGKEALNHFINEGNER